MACGLPIVCFNKTSASEYISHKVNGFIVDNISSDDLKRGIDWMYLETNKKINFQNLSKNEILKFDPKNIAKQYIELYSELL